MRRIAYILALITLILASGLVFAQTIIENPAKPNARRAGRLVTLKEEMRIEDTGKDFFIKYVFGVRVAPDGSIFVNDSGEQALQFDAQGRFVRNLMKKGQGPGELDQISDIGIWADQIILNGMPYKTLIFDRSGKMIQEVSNRESALDFIQLIDADERSLLFIHSGRPDLKAGSGWKDIPQEIIKIDRTSGEAITLCSFALPGFVSTGGGGMGVTFYRSFIAVPAGNMSLLISHTSEYLIKLIDRETGNLIRQFRRVYDRIRTKTSGKAKIPKGARPPAPEYWADIQAMSVVGDKLFVQTSTVDPKKGFLFDVFNLDGRYIDCFYLKWSDKDADPNRVGQRFTFSGGFVYYADKTADDLVVIKKCRLVGL